MQARKYKKIIAAILPHKQQTMAPRILQETQEILQSFYFINQEKICPMAPRIMRENGREWERWERDGRDFGIIELLWE
jgi:hypothetical protein